MDKIKIKNLEVFANHGVFPEETALGQKFLVSATMYTDTKEAGKKDELTLSIHYGEVCHYITDFMRGQNFKLIEAAAEHLAEGMLMDIPRLQKVKLEINKPWAPIGLPIESVAVEIERGWHKAYLSIGSNLGDKRAYLDRAIKQLGEVRGCIVEKVSSYLETMPYGKTDQPEFVNAAIALKTILSPEQLLEELHRIEAENDRERKEHWGPRTLDLDIVFYDQCVMDTEELTIPHIDMQNRAFVLEPLMELCPKYRHPVLQQTVEQLYKKLKDEV